MLTITLLLALYSCGRNDSNSLDDFRDEIPENIHLSDHSDESIAVAWDRKEGATSYTVQLLESAESNSPIHIDALLDNHYEFNGLRASADYYVRVRANFYSAISNWAYVMNDQARARIIPKYGIVGEDFVPEPEPELYLNFPEGWEVHEGTRKNGYPGELDVFPSGQWRMPNIHTTSAGTIINKIGEWAAMFRGNPGPILEMDFDLPNGASLFSFYYGAATLADANGLPIIVNVEYSQDSGETWTQLGDDLVVDDVQQQYFAEYELDIDGPVRFRIGKNNSSKLFVDEIAVRDNPK